MHVHSVYQSESDSCIKKLSNKQLDLERVYIPQDQGADPSHDFISGESIHIRSWDGMGWRGGGLPGTPPTQFRMISI